MNKHGVVSYYVDKEKRVVVCTICNTVDEAINLIRSAEQRVNGSLVSYIPYFNRHELEIKNSFSGKAVCSKDDVWDEAKGRRIAYHRARYKLDKAIFKRVQSYFFKADTALNMMEDFTNKFFSEEVERAKIREEKIGEGNTNDLNRAN